MKKWLAYLLLDAAFWLIRLAGEVLGVNFSVEAEIER